MDTVYMSHRHHRGFVEVLAAHQPLHARTSTVAAWRSSRRREVPGHRPDHAPSVGFFRAGAKPVDYRARRAAQPHSSQQRLCRCRDRPLWISQIAAPPGAMGSQVASCVRPKSRFFGCTDRKPGSRLVLEIDDLHDLPAPALSLPLFDAERPAFFPPATTHRSRWYRLRLPRPPTGKLVDLMDANLWYAPVKTMIAALRRAIGAADPVHQAHRLVTGLRSGVPAHGTQSKRSRTGKRGARVGVIAPSWRLYVGVPRHRPLCFWLVGWSVVQVASTSCGAPRITLHPGNGAIHEIACDSL